MVRLVHFVPHDPLLPQHLALFPGAQLTNPVVLQLPELNSLVRAVLCLCPFNSVEFVAVKGSLWDHFMFLIAS